MKNEPIFASPSAPDDCSVALTMLFVLVHRLRDRRDVGLRRVLRAQHALGLDHQRLDMVARLAAFAALDLGEPLRRAPVVDGFDAAAQLLVGARERIPRGDETGMQGLALGHPVVLVVLLRVIVVGLLEQRLELAHGFRVGRRGGFELGVARLERVGLLDVLAAIRRVVDRVGAVDDPLLAGRAVLADPAEIARARIVGALREPVDAADIGVDLFVRRRRLGGRHVGDQRRDQNSCADGAYECVQWLHYHDLTSSRS